VTPSAGPHPEPEPGAGPSPAAHVDPLVGRIGMWLFLFSEALLFGALFIAYAADINLFRDDFSRCSRELDRMIGAGNTLILLTSSLTVALSIAALERKDPRRSLACLAVTVLLAAAFLAVKSYEWGHKIAHGIYPNSAEMLARPAGEQTFYGLYFVMTGLHALHVAAGIGALAVAAALVARGRVRAERPGILVNVGLYWHLVDVIWIFLFPLFYLIR
jgi:cytochrome c oxidase subunit 3